MAFCKHGTLRFLVGAQFYWAIGQLSTKSSRYRAASCAPTTTDQPVIHFRPLDSTGSKGHHLTGSPVFFAAI